MQSSMPKNKKIQLVANVAMTALAVMNAIFATWYLIEAGYSISNIFNLPPLTTWLFAIGAVLGAGLNFLMVKIAWIPWTPRNKVKQFGVVLALVDLVLGAGSTAYTLHWLMTNPTVAVLGWDQAGWSAGLGLLAAATGVLLVAGALVGKGSALSKVLFTLGFVSLVADIMLLMQVCQLSTSASWTDLTWLGTPVLGALVTFISSFAMIVLGHYAGAHGSIGTPVTRPRHAMIAIRLCKIMIKTLVIIGMLLVVAFASERWTMNYALSRLDTGKPRAYAHGMDSSLPFLTSRDNTSVLLDNPDRGFRMETYMTLGTNMFYPDKLVTPADEQAVPTLDSANASLQQQLQKYTQDRPKIAQQYVYLTLYHNQSTIPMKALDQLKSYFEYVRTLNIKMLLRFAYRNENNLCDPTQDILLAHIAELKTWFENNSQLVVDTVYCLQLGFLGYWGEGWGFNATYNIPAIITAVCEMAPSWMYVMVRTLAYYNQVPMQYRARVGIHDDGMNGYYDPYATVMPNDPFQQAYYINLFQKTINDAELFWGGNGFGGNGYYIDGQADTMYAYNYALTTLSIVHNYIEGAPGGTFSSYYAYYALLRWQSEYFTASDFTSNGWNYNPHLLDATGKISIFNYLKYHLGYQLVLSNLTTGNGRLGFMISNYGFAAPFNMDTLTVHVAYANSTTADMNMTYTPHGLPTFGQLVYSISLDMGNVIHASVKLHSSRNSDYVRFGNKIVQMNGFYQLF